MYSQQTCPRGKRERSPRIWKAGRETDPPWLRGKTLTTLVAAALEHGPSSLSGHAGPKAVGLAALALVRLIGPLHVSSLTVQRRGTSPAGA